MPSGEPVACVKRPTNGQQGGGDMKVSYGESGISLHFHFGESDLGMMTLEMIADVISECDPQSAQELNEILDTIHKMESAVGHA